MATAPISTTRRLIASRLLHGSDFNATLGRSRLLLRLRSQRRDARRRRGFFYGSEFIDATIDRVAASITDPSSATRRSTATSPTAPISTLDIIPKVHHGTLLSFEEATFSGREDEKLELRQSEITLKKERGEFEPPSEKAKISTLRQRKPVHGPPATEGQRPPTGSHHQRALG